MEELNYTETMDKIKVLLEDIDNLEGNMDELMSKVKLAKTLIDQCKAQLLQTETEIEEIMIN